MKHTKPPVISIEKPDKENRSGDDENANGKRCICSNGTD